MQKELILLNVLYLLLQVLLEDASKLQMLYPGSNAPLIKEQQQIIDRNWTELLDKSAYRREMLRASCDLQQFLSQVTIFLFPFNL